MYNSKSIKPQASGNMPCLIILFNRHVNDGTRTEMPSFIISFLIPSIPGAFSFFKERAALRGVEWVHGLFLFPLHLGKM